MSGGTTLPVAAGMCAGIAMIAVFASLIDHDLDLSIEGLKNSYHAGEPIAFTLRVSGYGYYCQTPAAAIWNASSAFDSLPIWRSGLPSVLCPPYPQSHFTDDKYSWGQDGGAITIDKAGDYVMRAGGGDIPAAQKEFKVTQ